MSINDLYEGMRILVESHNNPQSEKAMDVAILVHRYNTLRKETRSLIESKGNLYKINANFYQMYSLCNHYSGQYPAIVERMLGMYLELKKLVKIEYVK